MLSAFAVSKFAGKWSVSGNSRWLGRNSIRIFVLEYIQGSAFHRYLSGNQAVAGEDHWPASKTDFNPSKRHDVLEDICGDFKLPKEPFASTKLLHEILIFLSIAVTISKHGHEYSFHGKPSDHKARLQRAEKLDHVQALTIRRCRVRQV